MKRNYLEKNQINWDFYLIRLRGLPEDVFGLTVADTFTCFRDGDMHA